MDVGEGVFQLSISLSLPSPSLSFLSSFRYVHLFLSQQPPSGCSLTTMSTREAPLKVHSLHATYQIPLRRDPSGPRLRVQIAIAKDY